MLGRLAPKLYERISNWPELKGVRVSLRVYRFVSSDERDLDLIRIELRIPGIGVAERFPIWRQFRTELDEELESWIGVLNSGEERKLARTLRENVSTAVVG